MKTEKLLLSAGIAMTLAFTGCASQQHSSDISAASSAEEKKKDITAPVITFTADSASVEAGTEYSPADNIKSVRDDVDGELKKADSLSKGKAGYVIDDSKTDLSAAGEYKVVVKAQDEAGNVSEKSFRLTVESKGSVEEAPEKKKKTESTEKKPSSESSAKKKASGTSSTSKSSSASRKTGASSSQKIKNSTASAPKKETVASQPSQPAQESKPAAQEHVHNWVWVDPVYETVVVKPAQAEVTAQVPDMVWVVKCNSCGAEFATYDELRAHQVQMDTGSDAPAHGGYTTFKKETGTYHTEVVQPAQPAQTEQKLVSPGHYTCTGCGDWKQ